MDNQALYRRAKQLIPGGTQLLSKRPEQMAPDQWPPYFKKAKGCRIIDWDGKEFIDFSYCGIAACLLGFNDDDVTEAVVKTVRDGSFCTLNPPEEVELAERLIAIHPWACCARFARCGGETAAMAVRIARAATGRSKVIVAGYHGWQDWYLAANLGDPDALGKMWLSGLSPYGVPDELVGTTLPLEHGDFDRLNDLFKKYGKEIAAVVMEPCRHELPPKGFLEAVRELCDRHQTMLIYDEITIGWRYRFGGSHLAFGVNPDMAIFSKAMGNGHPIGAVIGNRRMMEAGAKAFLSSTYWTERVGPAAALAVIDKMEKTNVSRHVTEYGSKVMQLWRKTADETGVPIQLTSSLGCLAAFRFDLPNANAVKTLFTQMMLDEGFLATTSFDPTLAHGNREFALFAAALGKVFGKLADVIRSGPDAVSAALKGPEAHVGFGRLLK